MEERHAEKKMAPKENVYPSMLLSHSHTASEDLDSSEGNSNGAQEDALPPARGKELWHGAVERNVGVACLGIP